MAAPNDVAERDEVAEEREITPRFPARAVTARARRSGLLTPMLTPARVEVELTPQTRSWLRVSLVLLVLSPLTVLLATRLVKIAFDPLLGIYGLLVLGTTTLVMYLSFAHYRDPARAPRRSTRRPSVSVLLAVKNELEVIEGCIRSIDQSTYERLEIIVVDDGSDDGTSELLAGIQTRRPLRVIHLDASQGKKRALTIGLEHATGELLVFTDSDCMVASDAIEHVVASFQSDPDIGAVSGHARALNSDTNLLTRAQDTWYEGQFSVWKAAESVFGAVTCVSGPMAAFRREAVYNFFPAWANDRFLGEEFPFATDRQLTGYVLGSEVIGDRLKAKHADSPFVANRNYPARKWKIVYTSSARVWTVVPDSLPRLLKQQVRWKKSFLRNLCFTGTFYWRKGLVPALLYYSHSLFVLMTPVMAFRHLLWFPLQGAWGLTLLYIAGIALKGFVWGAAYRLRSRDHLWIYRPVMSLLSAFAFSALLLYSAATVRRKVWARG